MVDLRARNSGRPFETRYGPIDIRLLAEVDEAFGQMSGLATCEILRRAFEVHGDPRFERLAGISRSHVYNLRGSRTYRAKRTTWTKTKGSNVGIARGAQRAGAERRAGQPPNTSRLPSRPGELNRSLRQGRLVPESSDTRASATKALAEPSFHAHFLIGQR